MSTRKLTPPEPERAKFIDSLRVYFCIHCGHDDPRCQCWNDE